MEIPCGPSQLLRLQHGYGRTSQTVGPKQVLQKVEWTEQECPAPRRTAERGRLRLRHTNKYGFSLSLFNGYS